MKFNWGTGIVLFFVVFFVFIFSFVFFALRQTNDLVTEDYYQKGANYTQQMNVLRRSVPFSDSIQVHSTKATIQFSFGRNIFSSTDSVQLDFFKSSDKSKDFTLNLKLGSSPLLIDCSKFVHGRYQADISWKVNNEKYSVRKLFDVE